MGWADAAGARGFILVALGSWGDAACSQLGADDTLLEALRTIGLPCAWKSEAMCTRGHQQQQQLPQHVSVARWLPLHGLLTHRNCRLLVCHGGANSISEAAAAGVPLVCLPIAWDQPANAEMVVELGIGLSMPLSELVAGGGDGGGGGGARLAALMRHVLDDGGMARRTTALAEAMREIDTGAVGAAELVESAARTFDGEMRAAAAAGAPDSCGGGGDRIADEADEGWGDALD